MQMLAGGAWHLADGVFLGGYLALVAVVVVGVALLRTVPASGPAPGQLADRLDNQPMEIAYLNGGRDLALLAACAALRAAGALDIAGRRLTATDTAPPADLPRLARRVHAAAGRGIETRRLRTYARVVDELDRITVRARRIAPVSGQPPRWRRYAWLAVLPLLALGVVRLVAGTGSASHRTFLELAMLLAVVATVAVALLCSPRRGRVTQPAVLRLLAKRHPELAPELRPSWRTYGPTAVALSVALFGPNAVTQADPDLIDALPTRTFRSHFSSGRVAGGSAAAAGGALFTTGLANGCGGGDSGCGGGCGGGGCGGGGCGGGGGGCGGGGCGGG